MPARDIILVPDPILRRKSGEIKDFTVAPSLAKDLTDTMYSHRGCVGIAAPQIGTLKRMIALDASRKKGEPGRGLLVLCNPRIIYRLGRKIGREGCLSLPDYTANVARATEVVIQAEDIMGKGVEISASEFEAVVLQHEMDHLDGVLFIDRVSNLKTDVFRRKSYRYYGEHKIVDTSLRGA